MKSTTRAGRSKRETVLTCAAWLGLFYALAVFGGMEMGTIEIGHGFVRVLVALAVTLGFCWGARK